MNKVKIEFKLKKKNIKKFHKFQHWFEWTQFLAASIKVSINSLKISIEVFHF